MRKFTFTSILSLFLIFLNAQKIEGVIIDMQDNPISYADVILYTTQDSSVYKFTYTNDDGSFLIEDAEIQSYYLKVSFLGNEDLYRPLDLRAQSNQNLGILKMSSSNITLDEVVVKAQKPLFEVKPDKLVLNVSGSVLSTGDDALNLLRKSPGVVIDNNDNITLLGKTGVIIYVDGKPSPLSSSDLANMLRNMSSNDIEAIEIISNPSAKYDAQGTGGIINIKRKKSNNEGTNGSVSLTGRQGLTSGSNANLNLNTKTSRMNINSSAQYYYSENRNWNDFIRYQNDLNFQTLNTNNNKGNGGSAKIVADYTVNEKSGLGLIAEYNLNDFSMINNAQTLMGVNNFSVIDSILVNNGTSNDNNATYNLGLNYFLNKKDAYEWIVDVGFSRFDKDSWNFTPNEYTTPDGLNVTSTFFVRTLTPVIIDIQTYKIDHERQWEKWTLNAGWKSGIVKTNNTFDFYNIVDEVEVINDDLSNKFIYTEAVHAGYVEMATQIKSLALKGGMRVEHSRTEGDLRARISSKDQIVKRKYTNLFPSFSLALPINSKHNVQMGYSRRINRPNYQDLNPFESQLDQITFEKGNPFLNPEYVDNIQLTHTYNYRFNTTLSYSHIDQVITRLVDTSGLKGSFITWDNIAYRKVFSANFSAPIQLSQWWSTFTSLTGVHTLNKADFGDGKIIDLAVSTFNFYQQHNFTIGKGWSAEVSGWYSSPSIWEGTFRMNEMWSMGAGLSKKMADGRSKVTLSIDDIFKTNVWSGISEFGGLFMDVSGGWDSRRVRLTATYNFGRQINIKTRQRKSAFEEEQQRIKKG